MRVILVIRCSLQVHKRRPMFLPTIHLLLTLIVCYASCYSARTLYWCAN